MESKVESQESSRAWDVYCLLVGTIHNYHQRWIDNYRIFLTFNSIIITGATGILLWSLKESNYVVILFIFLLSVIGITITLISSGLISRIRVDTDLRFQQITWIEEHLEHMPLCPYEDGYRYFFDEIVPEYFRNPPEKRQGVRKIFPYRGIRGLWAYRCSGYLIIAYYFLLGWYCLSVYFTSPSAVNTKILELLAWLKPLSI